MTKRIPCIPLMLYTMEVKCWDGVTRRFVRTGYFENTDVLRHQLGWWNNMPGPADEPYRYFETLSQIAHNDGACCIPLDLIPRGALLYHGPCQHDYEIVEGNKNRCGL